jgi:hypothetical protein
VEVAAAILLKTVALAVQAVEVLEAAVPVEPLQRHQCKVMQVKVAYLQPPVAVAVVLENLAVQTDKEMAVTGLPHPLVVHL